MATSCSQEKYPDVVLETQYGNIVIRLYDKTPQHSENFLKLVKEGYYDGQLFHRVIKNFMIQAGDPNSKNAQPGIMLGNGGPGYTIPAEFVPEYFHKKGALAAARLGDDMNPKKESSGSQFYIVQGQKFTEADLRKWEERGMHAPFTPEQIQEYTTFGGAPHLDGAYTVFGELIEGYDILDIIASQHTDPFNRPLEDIEIIKMYTKKK